MLPVVLWPVVRWNTLAHPVRMRLITTETSAGTEPEIAVFPLKTKIKTNVQKVFERRSE